MRISFSLIRRTLLLPRSVRTFLTSSSSQHFSRRRTRTTCSKNCDRWTAAVTSRRTRSRNSSRRRRTRTRSIAVASSADSARTRRRPRRRSPGATRTRSLRKLSRSSRALTSLEARARTRRPEHFASPCAMDRRTRPRPPITSSSPPRPIQRDPPGRRRSNGDVQTRRGPLRRSQSSVRHPSSSHRHLRQTRASRHSVRACWPR